MGNQSVEWAHEDWTPKHPSHLELSPFLTGGTFRCRSTSRRSSSNLLSTLRVSPGPVEGFSGSWAMHLDVERAVAPNITLRRWMNQQMNDPPPQRDPGPNTKRREERTHRGTCRKSRGMQCDTAAARYSRPLWMDQRASPGGTMMSMYDSRTELQ